MCFPSSTRHHTLLFCYNESHDRWVGFGRCLIDVLPAGFFPGSTIRTGTTKGYSACLRIVQESGLCTVCAALAPLLVVMFPRTTGPFQRVSSNVLEPVDPRASLLYSPFCVCPFLFSGLCYLFSRLFSPDAPVFTFFYFFFFDLPFGWQVPSLCCFKEMGPSLVVTFCLLSNLLLTGPSPA